MELRIEEATPEFKAWTVRVLRGQAEDLLRGISETARKTASDVLIMNGEYVFGSDHVRSAFYHAMKAIEEGRNASDSIAIETLLYSSGERQLSTAMKKMSVDRETQSVAVVRLRGLDFKPSEGWDEMPRMPPEVDIAGLKRYGFSDHELGTVSRERAVELVLERVASVDVLKK